MSSQTSLILRCPMLVAMVKKDIADVDRSVMYQLNANRVCSWWCSHGHHAAQYTSYVEFLCAYSLGRVLLRSGVFATG